MGFFQDFITKIKLVGYYPKIIKQFSAMENKLPELKLKQIEVSQYKTLIPGEYVTNIKNENKDVIEYIESAYFYSFDKRLALLYLSLAPKKIPKKFHLLESKYIELCKKYTFELTELEKGVEETNKKLKPFYDGLEKFLEEIKIAKKDYFSHTTFTYFKRKI